MRIGPAIGIPGDAAAPTGGFSPAQFPGLVLWLRADMGITLNGSTVSAWADQSGTGHHLTQVTASLQPLFVASGSTGKPAVRFDGVDDFMDVSFTLSQPTTVTAVFKMVTLGAHGAHDIIMDGKTLDTMAVFDDSLPLTQMDAGVGGPFINSATANGSYAQASFIFNGASSSLFTGNTSTPAATGDVGTGVPGGVTLAGLAGGLRSTNVEYAEVIVYARVLATSELARVVSYAQARYAL